MIFSVFLCLNPIAIDGDTIRCSNSEMTIRLVAVDAPELGRCKGRVGRVCIAGDGPASRAFTQGALNLGPVTVTPHKLDLYGRIVATVRTADQANLSCSLIASGNAVAKPQWDFKGVTLRECRGATIVYQDRRHYLL